MSTENKDKSKRVYCPECGHCYSHRYRCKSKDKLRLPGDLEEDTVKDVRQDRGGDIPLDTSFL